MAAIRYSVYLSLTSAGRAIQSLGLSPAKWEILQDEVLPLSLRSEPIFWEFLGYPSSLWSCIFLALKIGKIYRNKEWWEFLSRVSYSHQKWRGSLKASMTKLSLLCPTEGHSLAAMWMPHLKITVEICVHVTGVSLWNSQKFQKKKYSQSFLLCVHMNSVLCWVGCWFHTYSKGCLEGKHGVLNGMEISHLCAWLGKPSWG